jgi:glycosyltransferase involved in cell wall biosynthesis
MEKVSIIVPTKDRKDSLFKTLAALSKQRAVIHEVIVVDSSDTPIDFAEIQGSFAFEACVLLHTRPSVCVQRNEGIRRATGDFVLLLDDDNLVDGDYIVRCLAFLKSHPDALIVSGLVIEKSKSGGWDFTPPGISRPRLAWNFVFQLSVWTDLGDTDENASDGFFPPSVRRHYQRRGNGLSKAGWPVLTRFSKPFFRTQIYYLSAAMIKKDWLRDNLFSEKLDQHGIGDNYGVTIKLRPEQGIFILTDTYSYHDKSPANRLAVDEAYYKRVLALDYFTTLNGTASRGWLVWSLFGNFLDACLHLKMERAIKNGRLIGLLILDRNPLLR